MFSTNFINCIANQKARGSSVEQSERKLRDDCFYKGMFSIRDQTKETGYSENNQLAEFQRKNGDILALNRFVAWASEQGYDIGFCRRKGEQSFLDLPF